MATNCSPSRQSVTSEEWFLVRCLGSGSYGDVNLYENKNENKLLAVKRFKGKLQHQKSCNRWMNEVKILKTLDHRNIVKAFDVPDQLIDPTSHHPLLATEYCEGGNLRKVIGKICHLSGLPQREVFNILSQSADGLLYLHKKEIIHRDLKPENIVLKPTKNEIIYKIIDLGFAKDLENETASSSFAGTLVYADPYLHMKRHYDKAVDYWSMGVLCFELITGRRPFSPVEHQPPVPFYNCMKQRPNNCVCMMPKIQGFEFSGTIPKENSLSRDAMKSFEIWIQSMFLEDRSKREYIVLNDESSVHWHDYLKEVTNMKEYKVFDMKANKLLTYRSDRITSVRVLQEHLAKEEEANIPLESQLLLLPDGQVALPSAAPSARKIDNVEANMELPDYFLFDKSVSQSASNSINHSTALPPLAKAVADNPSTHVEGKKILRCIWAEMLFVCKTEAKEAAWAVEGCIALKKYFERQTRDINSNTRKMEAVFDNISGMCEMFRKSITDDLESYKEQVECGIHCDEMVSKWINSKKLCNIPNDLMQRVRNIFKWNGNLKKGFEFSRADPTQITGLQKCQNKSVDLYAKAAGEWKSQKIDIPVCSNWREIVTCMEQSRKERLAVGQVVAESVKNLLQILGTNDPATIKTEIFHVIELLKEHKEKLMVAQHERQKHIWRSVRYLVEKCKALKQKNVQEGLMSIETSSPEPPTLSSQGANESAENFYQRSPASLRTLEDSHSIREEFTEAVDRCNAESKSRLRDLEGLDWGFGEPT